MKSALRVLIIICCFTGIALSSSLDTSKANNIRSLTLKGLEYAYNLDFQNATRLFDEAHNIEPLHPRPLLGKASMKFWQLMIQKDDSSYEQFISDVEKIIDAGDRYLDRYGKDADVYTSLGTAYAYRAFAHARMKSYLKAAWDGKKSYDYFNDAIELDHRTYDAYAGVGVFHYFATFLPKALQWAGSILGVPGDGDRGIKEIGIAAEKGTFLSVESKFCIAELLPWYSDDFDSSAVILRKLAQKYPGNSLFLFTVAVWDIKKNDVQSARDILLKIEGEEHNPIPGLRNFIDYKLGECYFRLRDYPHSQEYYQRFLNKYKDEVYNATANYRIGICREMTGRKNESTKYFALAEVSKSKFGDDKYSARKAVYFAKNPFGYNDSLLLCAQNLFKSGKYDKAIELYARLKSQPSLSSVMRTEAIYGMGETYFEQGSYTNALKYFQEVTAQHLPASDIWMFPWAYYYSGISCLKLNNKPEAKKAFEKVSDYDEYDFEQWLSYRTKLELDRLK
jgi:tetratricopeptide (TPR) repeat protein